MWTYRAHGTFQYLQHPPSPSPVIFYILQNKRDNRDLFFTNVTDAFLQTTLSVAD